MKESNFLSGINYDALPSFQASKLIGDPQNLPEGNTKDGYLVVKAKPAINPSELKIAHGLCLAQGSRIPKDKQNQFLKKVSDTVVLYFKSLKSVRTRFTRIMT